MRALRVHVSLVACLLSLPALAADWPQYRGPNRDDVSRETGLLRQWPAEGPPLIWTYANAGVGYSGPAIVGNRLYALGGRGEEEFLIALDLSTVKDRSVSEAWQVRIGPLFTWKGNNWSAGPSATPTVDGDRIFALGGMGDLICVDTAGQEKWRKNCSSALEGQVNPIGGGPKNLGWGYTGSPLVDGERLICAVGGPKGTLAALDKRTGDVLWRSAELKDQAAYTSPMPAEIGGVKQYVILTNQGLAGIAAADGKLLWSYRRQPAYGTEVVNTPLVRGSLIYATVGAGAGCDLIKVEADAGKFQVELVYANKNLANHHGNVVLLDNHIYGHSQNGGWVCQEWQSGQIAWSERQKLRAGSMTYADGCFYLYGEDDGTAVLIEANPTAWKEVGRFKIPQQSKQRKPSGKVWTPPVVANGKLFLRDQELLFCFDVKK